MMIFWTVCLIIIGLPIVRAVSPAQFDCWRPLATQSEVELPFSDATLMKAYILNEAPDFLFDAVVEVFLRFDLELRRILCDQILVLSLDVLGEEKEFFEEFFISLVLMEEFGDEVVEVLIFPGF